LRAKNVEKSDGEKKLIFVVDDQEENLEFLGSLLRHNNYNVMVASDGIEALNFVHKKLPDLILLDIMMPKMDGYEVCEKLKSNEHTKDIPVIFITAKIETEDIVRGFQVGGVDYVTKPFKHKELLSRVKTQLELKQSKDLIIKQNEKLIKLNQDKNGFLRIAAHDLKNPLFTIKGFAQLINQKYKELSPQEVKEYTNYITDTADQCLQIIINLLDINKIEDGQLKLTYDDINLDEVITKIIDTYVLKAKAKDINLVFNNNHEKVFINADTGKVIQVLSELISNAIKFSPFKKSIYINSTISDEKKRRARVEVRDEGPGLTDDDKSKLFTKFSKLSAQPTGDENSTGLGLNIVKYLVEAMGGKVWAESEAGKGASFFIEFKLKN